ncbi:MAG: class I SAM-dependent methyltransferase [Candidatus Lokiarchaeota archaeon]|nr:class I SAM-dependent methyltransferase [Candidatus Lokiarchaeota archaeon]
MTMQHRAPGARDQWYEGLFYKTVIAPFLQEVRGIIRDMVAPGSAVLDAGCGTGDLAIMLASKCNRVVGVERSARMIEVARNSSASPGQDGSPLHQAQVPRQVEFVHRDIVDYLNHANERFDHVVFSFSLHEMEPATRAGLVSKAGAIARDVIIADFNMPGWDNAWGVVNTVTEALSNLTHFSRYIDFINRGGIPALVRQAGMRVVEQRADSSKRLSITRAVF